MPHLEICCPGPWPLRKYGPAWTHRNVILITLFLIMKILFIDENEPQKCMEIEIGIKTQM
jgi:hypothetical protein